MPPPSPLSFEDSSLELPTKPGAFLHYTYNPAPDSDYLLVCLNGLVAPQSSWFELLHEFSQRCRIQNIPRPSILTYDRWAQGRTTTPDPLDSLPGKDPKYGHDMLDVVHDLHQLLLAIGHKTAHNARPQGALPRLILAGNSIGCCIARVYAQTYPGTAHAFIFLDSMICHTDFISLWPDPDDPSFDASTSLPPGVPASALRQARETSGRIFHPSVPNPEHLDRRSVSTLLPSASRPALPRVDATGEAPLLVVVGHDPVTFAADSEVKLGQPAALTLMHAHARWHEYNEESLLLTDRDKARGPVIAPGTTHFVQVDAPGFVADVVADVVEALMEGRSLSEW